MAQSYIGALKSGDQELLRNLSRVGTKNIEKVFKGFPKPPCYVKGALKIAGWDITYQPLRNNIMGYFLPSSEITGGIALRKDNVTWMSLTPFEFESHMLPMNSAKGCTVIAGLGLGMITLNILAKQSVKRLVVLEYDSELIKDFKHLLADDSRNLWDASIKSGRLELICCDCKNKLTKQTIERVGKVDYLWVDIWAKLGTKEAIDDTLGLCRQLSPKACDYWGMEIDVISIMKEHKLPITTKGAVKAINLQSVPSSSKKMNKIQLNNYADLVIMAGTNFIIGAMKQENNTRTVST